MPTINHVSNSNLLDSTNIYFLRRQEGPPTGLPTPPSEHKRVRQLEFDGRDKKRLRVASPCGEHAKVAMEVDEDSDSDSEDEDGRNRARCRYSMYGLRSQAMVAGPLSISRQLPRPTRSIMQSFVSSHKSDVFKCESINEMTFTTLPYACSYSHAAKRGGMPHLAVATEQGTVHILNTEKRRGWDPEPQRITVQPHCNGIFDIKWSPSDTLLATASGDQSIRIISLAPPVHPSGRTVHVLRGHQSTVKCVAWDPAYDGTVLCSGSRDGTICLWDLRAGESHSDGGMRTPVLTIPKAHESHVKSPKARGRSRKVVQGAPAKGITNLMYADNHHHGIISSSSFDGILHLWDVRLPTNDTPKKRSTKSKAAAAHPKPLFTTSCDPTSYDGTRRPRGITTLATGSGPTAGLLYALGTDSRVHTYAMPSLSPLSGYPTAELGAPDPHAHTHTNMQTNSFYVRLAASPCGRWLASGNASDGKAYLFDIASTASAARARDAARWRGGWEGGVELRGQTGEVGAMDWAEGMLATCADDGTVRVWRPDVEVSRRCLDEPEEMKWDWAWALDIQS